MDIKESKMITQFTVGASRTTNLGNFESLRVEASVTIDVPEYAKPAVGVTLEGQVVQFDKHPDLSIAETLRREAQQVLRQLMEDTYNEFKVKKEKK